jgi:hypothetical protein
MRRGGYVADFPTTSDPKSYMLYFPPAADNNAVAASTGVVTTPGITGGNGVSVDDNSVELPNNFLYSSSGGCALCSASSSYSGGSDKSKSGGVGLELAPFISALALLGARLLADEEIGMFNTEEEGYSKKGGRTYRAKSARY